MAVEAGAVSALEGKATGGAEAPPQVGACFVFIIRSGLLFLLIDPFPRPSGFRKTPNLEVSSKRIALDADVAMIMRSNQFGLCLGAVLLFSAWLWGKPQRQVLSKRIS